MDTPGYLLVKGFSGMGNRLYALAEAIVYAQVSGRRLLVDWNDALYSPDGRDVFAQLFASPEAGPVSAAPPDGSVVPEVWSGRLAEPFDDMISRHQLRFGTEARAHLSIDPERDYSETVAVIYDFQFRLPRLTDRPAACPQEWRGLSATELARTLIRDGLRPHARVAARVEAFARQHFAGPTIGVHVRQSDNMSPAVIQRKGVSVSAIDTALAGVLRTVPDATIFLATDNRTVQDAFGRRYRRLVVHPKWHPRASGEAIHGHWACPDKLRAAEDALVDMYLLARCDFLIYSSRATFAQCAAHISRQPAERRVDVEQPPSQALEAARWIRRRPWWDDLPRRAARGVVRRLRRAWTGNPSSPPARSSAD